MTRDEIPEWAKIRYGDTDSARAACAYYRERGWPVDDPNVGPFTEGAQTRVMAFQSGWDEAIAALRAAPPAPAPECRCPAFGCPVHTFTGPAPAPELVALVQRMLAAYSREIATRAKWSANTEPYLPESQQMFDAVLAREAETRSAALAVDAALRTPAPPVEPPARPETFKCIACPFQGAVPGATPDTWTCPKCGRYYELSRPETAAPTPQPDEDDGKIARDHAPRYSQVDMDMATKPLHAEIERLRAAPTPAPTREQKLMEALEWCAAEIEYGLAAGEPRLPGGQQVGRSAEGFTCVPSTRKRLAHIAKEARAALSSPVGETPEGK